MPIFQFETENYILGIRHLLIVESEEYNSMNYIGLFIGKQKDNNFSEPKKINIKHKTVFTTAYIEINFKKQTFYFVEKVIFKIHTNLEYKIGDLSLDQKLYRKIQWKGYMKNSLINKTIYEIQEIKQNKKNEDINDDELEIIDEIFEAIGGPFVIGAGGIIGRTFRNYLIYNRRNNMPEYIIRYNCWRNFIIYHRIYNRRGSCNKDARYSLLFSFSIF